MWSPSLRARLVAAFVGVVAIGTFLAALLSVVVVHHSFADYLDQRAEDAATHALSAAEDTYRQSHGWTTTGLDRLAHDLALTGYDFRLQAGRRVLLDTTRSTSKDRKLSRIVSTPVRSPEGRQVAVMETYALSGGGSTPADADFRSQLDRVHLIAAALASLIAIAVGLLLARRLTRSLKALAGHARALGRGEATAPTPAAGPPEIRDLSLALAALEEDLDRQARSRRQLAQDLAHELRTPLTLVRSRIEAMQDDVVPFDRDGLESLHSEVLRLTRLIGEIERLAEAEATPRSLRTRSVELDVLARETVESLTSAFDSEGVVLTIDAEPVRALADPDAVRQIVTNLLSNALKYTPAGGTVEVRTEEREARAVLSVRDSGPGVAADDKDHIFDRFFRGRDGAPDGTAPGDGLGLTIARQLAVAQRGDLVLAAPGPGAEFRLTLPRAPASGDARGWSNDPAKSVPSAS